MKTYLMNYWRAVAVVMCMMIGVQASAIEEKYTPTTAWPYLYEEFQEGVVTTFRGEVINHNQLNVDLMRGKAHFVQNDVLMELDLRAVAKVSIGEDEFIPVSGSLVQVIGRAEHGVTALSITVNLEAMNRSEVGYGGTSSLTNTQKVSANAIAGGTGSSEYRSLSEMAKQEGKPLVLKKVRGLVYNGAFIPASKYDIMNIVGIDKDAVKKFMKDKKIRLSDDENLLMLADYIGTL